MMHIVYPIFFFTFLIFISLYKYEMIGGFDESASNYLQAQQKYYEKWKEREKIRIDKKNKERQLDNLNKIKREKKNAINQK